MKNQKINKQELIDELVLQVIDSWTQSDLISFAERHLEEEYQTDFDLLVDDALTFNLIKNEEEIV